MRVILHVSDLHFGPPHRPAAAAALDRLVREQPPDLVVVSGDHTQRAKPHQFRQAREFLSALPAPVLAVPGNHDVPMYRFWERVFRPFSAYRRHFSSELEPTFEDDELLVVGLNSAYNWTTKHGRVLRAQAERAATRLQRAGTGKFRVLVIHHPLAPVPGFARDRLPRGAAQAVARCAAAGAELVLCGHLHQRYRTVLKGLTILTVLTVPAPGPGLPLLMCGTTTSNRGRGHDRGRCGCYRITVSQHELLVEDLEWQHDRFVAVGEVPLVRGRGALAPSPESARV